MIDRKVAALRAHASQVAGMDVDARVRQWLADRGRPHGYAYAESFRVVSLRR